jgi:ribosome-associated protein
MHDQYLEYARVAADAAEDKKATDVVILDIRGLSVIADFFIICSARSRTQVLAVADAVEERLALQGVRCKGIEGREEGKWVLIDFGDLVVHVFNDEERKFFSLERLWGDAERIPMHAHGVAPIV